MSDTTKVRCDWGHEHPYERVEDVCSEVPGTCPTFIGSYPCGMPLRAAQERVGDERPEPRIIDNRCAGLTVSQADDLLAALDAEKAAHQATKDALERLRDAATGYLEIEGGLGDDTARAALCAAITATPADLAEASRREMLASFDEALAPMRARMESLRDNDDAPEMNQEVAIGWLAALSFAREKLAAKLQVNE
jgi:hypothetical protein